MTLPGVTFVITVSSGSVQTLSSGAALLSTAGITQVYNVSTAGAVGPVTSSAGQLCSLSSGTITSTAATNPWSSAPGFNVPVVSVSSGLVQLSSQITVTATGPVTVTSGIITLSTAAFNPVTIATTGPASILVTSSGGPVFSAGVNTAAGYGPVTSSAGRLSSLSSGTVTLSSVHTVTATAGTNPWSSAPGFNVPVVNVSSGLVQLSGIPTVGISSTLPATGKFVVATSISKVTSSATTLWGYIAFTTAPGGEVIRFYNAATGSVTMNTGVVLASPVSAQSSVGGNWQAQTMFGPRGFNFGTACSFDVVLNATSTLATAGQCFVTAFVN